MEKMEDYSGGKEQQGGKCMKKFICMAMAAMLTMGAVPAYGAESFFVDVSHTFTAKVGTTEFTKDGEAQPLDVAVYIKDGYTMLPLRTFMTAALEKATMLWEDGTATVLYGYHIISFDVKNNKIMKNGKELPVYGKMEIRDGRVFVPLRNWGNILQSLGYVVENGDITWNKENRLATIRAVEQKLDVDQGLVKPAISGEGEAADFALEMSTDYDELENVGDGYFIAQKYPEENVGLGQIIGGRDNIYSLLDVKTGQVRTYAKGDSLEEMGEGWILLEARAGGNEVYAFLRRDTQIQAYFRPDMVESISEGMILLDYEGKYGFCPMTKKDGEKIKCQYEDANGYSEGLAAVCLKDEVRREVVNGMPERIRNIEWGYIDKTGKLVIDEGYTNAEPFYEGLARVRTEAGYGYIDTNGNEVIPCQYKWGGYFRNGVTYVTDYENRTWLIDKTGEKRKLIAEGESMLYADDRTDEVNAKKNGILYMEQIVDTPDGDHSHVHTYYDETGQISYEEYQLKKGLSEGLSPWYDAETEKYGYVNENGIWMIAPAFDKAEPFEDSYAVVANEITLENGEKDVEWGIIEHPNK